MREVPEITGEEITVGAARRVTAAVDTELKNAEPLAFCALTPPTMNRPTSVDPRVKLEEVAPAIIEHLEDTTAAALVCAAVHRYQV